MLQKMLVEGSAPKPPNTQERPPVPAAFFYRRQAVSIIIIVNALEDRYLPVFKLGGYAARAGRL